MSSSMSTEKPGVALFAKQVAEFMKGGNDYENDSDDFDEESQSYTDNAAKVKKTGVTTKTHTTTSSKVATLQHQAVKKQPVSIVNKQKPQMSDDESEEDSDEDEDSDEQESEKNNDDDDDESSSLSKSGSNAKAPGELGSITQMYEKYKKMQEMLAKYNNGNGDFDESATISMSK